MSFKSLLAHRCTILRQDVDLRTGSASYSWVEVATNVPCFIDLNFIRKGKDPMWTAEAGRTPERTGVGFFSKRAQLQNGDWIKVTTGPVGVFSIETAIDEAWRPTTKHHFEVSLKEIPRQFAKGQVGAPLPPTDPVPQFPEEQAEAIEDIDQLSGPFADIPGIE